MTDEQTIERLRAHNKMCVAQYKKVNEELTAARNNQQILINLLADTMKRLREAEAALEEEKKKHAPVASLLYRRDPWSADLWESGARAYEALLAKSRPLEARACDGAKEPVTVPPTTVQPTTTQPSPDEEDLYA